MAWYQSDIQGNSTGNATVTIHTILVNQIFGFDAGTGLAAVNIFNVGFWFDDPADAANVGLWIQLLLTANIWRVLYR